MTFLIDLANRTYYFEDAAIGEALNSRRYQFLAFDSNNLHRFHTLEALRDAFMNKRLCVLWMDKDTGEQFADIMSANTLFNLFHSDLCQDDDIDAVFDIADLKNIG